MNREFADTWASALSTDIDALVSLYADQCVVDLGSYADSVDDALIDPDALRARAGPLFEHRPGQRARHPSLRSDELRGT